MRLQFWNQFTQIYILDIKLNTLPTNSSLLSSNWLVCKVSSKSNKILVLGPTFLNLCLDQDAYIRLIFSTLRLASVHILK